MHRKEKKKFLDRVMRIVTRDKKMVGTVESLKLTPRRKETAPSCGKVLGAKLRKRFGQPGRTLESILLFHELYQWFIDIIRLLKVRVSSGIVLYQARIIASDIYASVLRDIEHGRLLAGLVCRLPKLISSAGMRFIRGWMHYFHVSWRRCSLRFKCSAATILLRRTMFWENCFRIRWLHYFLVGSREILKSINSDEKPMWFNPSLTEASSHSKEQEG